MREKQFNVLITTYNLAFQKADRSFLKKFRFDYLVLGKQTDNTLCAAGLGVCDELFVAKSRLTCMGMIRQIS